MGFRKRNFFITENRQTVQGWNKLISNFNNSSNKRIKVKINRTSFTTNITKNFLSSKQLSNIFLWNILRDDVLGHAITFSPTNICNTQWILLGKCTKLEEGIYLDSLFSIADIKETLARTFQILSNTKNSEEMENTHQSNNIVWGIISV